MRTACGCVLLVCGLLTATGESAHAFGVFNTTGLDGGSRWDAAPRTYSGLERSLDGGLRYSLEGGSFADFRDMFTWSSTPSVADFQTTVQDAFDAWTAVDPATGLGTDLYFVADLSTPVSSAVTNSIRQGAEIDLFAATSTSHWSAGSNRLQGVSSFNSRSTSTMKLTSGTTGYSGYAMTGADITLNNNPQATWTLDWFRLILTHEIGHALGLADVDLQSGVDGTFIDDNFSSGSPAATLTNSFAALIDTADPGASPLNFYYVTNNNAGFEAAGVNILMESNIDSVLLSQYPYLSNDDFAGRQFLYPFVPSSLLLGDANNDGVVDGADLVAVETNFGATGGDGTLLGDANDDGVVDFSDLIAVQRYFGSTQPSGSPASLALDWSAFGVGHGVPEPGTAALGLLGVMSLCGVRRRG